MGSNVVDGFLKEIEWFYYEPVPTGIEALDNAVGGGLIRRSLVLLEGEPGVGKTALATQIFENMAQNAEGEPTMYFSPGADIYQILARGISRLMYLNGSAEMTALEVLQGNQSQRTEEQSRAVTDAALKYKKHIVKESGITYNPANTGTNLEGILSYIEKEALRRYGAREPVPFVVIDSLPLLTFADGGRTEEFIKRATYSLKSYAMRYNSVVFVIMGQDESRDVSALKYSADLHLQLTREDELTPSVATLYVKKNRFGESGVRKDQGIKLAFLGGQSLFIPLDKWLKSRAAKAKPAAKSKKDAYKEE